MGDETHIRKATLADVTAMSECRRIDAGGVDERMPAYFRCEHDPHQALMPRVGFLAESGGRVVGYIAGHLTTRHGADGELQYLYVLSHVRRRGIGTRLIRALADWFCGQGARTVCVGVDADSPAAIPFYRALGARPLSDEKPLWYVWRNVAAVQTET